MSKRIPYMARGRRNRFFEAEGIDDLVSMIMELTAEVSALRERQYVTEHVLATKGIAITDEIENWVPSEQDEAALGEQRKRLLANVLRTLDVEAKGIGENTLEKGPAEAANG